LQIDSAPGLTVSQVASRGLERIRRSKSQPLQVAAILNLEICSSQRSAAARQ